MSPKRSLHTFVALSFSFNNLNTSFAPLCFLAALAWNGAIEALITEVIGESGSAVTGMLIYAIVVTIVAVVVTLLIGRLVGKAGIDIDE